MKSLTENPATASSGLVVAGKAFFPARNMLLFI